MVIDFDTISHLTDYNRPVGLHNNALHGQWKNYALREAITVSYGCSKRDTGG